MLYRLKSLFGIFFYLSLVTLGGGLAMLPGMRDAFVEKRKWMTDEEMVDVVAAMQSMPGIIACNMGVLLGYRLAGIPGALVSLLGAVLPPFVAIVALANVVRMVQGYPVLEHLFLGVRATVAAMLLSALLGLGKQVFRSPEISARVFSWGIAAGSFLALSVFGCRAVYVLLAAAALGWLSAAWRRAGKRREP